jgi:MFS family permease
LTGEKDLSLTGKDRSGRSPFFYGYVIVIAAALISIIMWGARQSFGVFIVPMLDQFNWTRASTSAGFSITWIGTGLLSILVGRLHDRFGPRVILTVAGFLLGLGYFLISRLDGIWQLYLYYGVINAGMSAALVPVMSTVARWFVKMRAFMSGIVLAGTGVALIVVVPLANQLISNYGWRTSYLIVGISAFVVIVISAQFLRRDPFKMGKLPYGYDPSSQPASGAAISGLTLKEALRTRQIWLMGAVYACTYLLFYTVVAHMVLYATGEGIPIAQAVAILSFAGGSGIAGRILMGIFADRVGHKQAMVLSAILLLISFFWLLFSHQIWMLYVFGVLFGFGHGGLATMESPMTAQIFGMRSHGTILGMVFTGDTLGGTLGPILAGFIFDQTRSYVLALEICAAITVINFAMVLLLKPVKQAERAPEGR